MFTKQNKGFYYYLVQCYWQEKTTNCFNFKFVYSLRLFSLLLLTNAPVMYARFTVNNWDYTWVRVHDVIGLRRRKVANIKSIHLPKHRILSMVVCQIFCRGDQLSIGVIHFSEELRSTRGWNRFSRGRWVRRNKSPHTPFLR